MREDDEGFLYPEVDESVCIDCGLCEKVCPVIHQARENRPIVVCAAKNKSAGKCSIPCTYYNN